MYLKRIEMAGFKSFAERTVIELEKGITAIVGPNGSGKSNITEAIRWVMGEQSAKNLRGDKMNDIIFAGTNKRSPLNIAEVTLVIDNSDSFLPIEYNEVSITRRLTRAGDSDFMINQQPCRLRDIVNLFTDSGLGKHSFTMISQGRVAEIFENKPEDRRYLFEEAAGVLKYKQRKQQAEHKLAQTEENLDRIDDILYELETQLTPLKEQSQTACQYTQWHDQHIQLEQRILFTEITAGQRHKKHYQEQLQHTQSKGKAVDQQLKKCQQRLQELQDKIQIVQQKLDDKKANQIEQIEQIERLETTRQVMLERLQNNEKTTSEIQQQRLEEEAKSLELTTQKAQLVGQIGQKQQQLAQEKKAYQALEQRLKDSQQPVASVEELQAQYFELMQQQANTRNKLQQLENDYERYEYQMQKLSAEQKERQNEQRQVTAVINDLLFQQKEQQTLQKENEQQLAAKEKVLQELKKRQREKQAQLKKARHIYEKAQAKQASLAAVQKNYDGFFQGVQAVLTHRDQLTGIIGAVAEQMEVPAKYRAAIESALGAAMQNIIVDNEQAAKEAIQFLKTQRAGTATFLPLNVIKGRYLPSDVLDKCLAQPGFIGVAANLVAHDSRVHSVIQSLLGQILLVDEMDHAIQLARVIEHQYKIVTLDGDMIRTGGAMTGGDRKQRQKGLLSQAAQLDELAEQITKMQARVAKEEHQQEQLQQDIEQLTEVIAQLKVEATVITRQLQFIDKELAVHQKSLADNQQDDQAASVHNQTAQSFMQTYADKKAVLTKQLADYQEEAGKKQHQLEDMQSSAEERQQKQNALFNQVSAAKTQIEVLKKDLHYLKEQLAQIEKQQSEVQQKIRRFDQQLSLMDQSITPEEVEQQTTKQEQLKEQLKRTEASMQTLQQQLKDSEATEKKLQSEQTSAEEARQLLQTEQQAQAVQLSEIKTKLHHYLETLSTQHHLTYESLLAQGMEEIEIVAAKQQAQQLKEQMNKLGPVNMNAIAQFEEVNERYSFIKQQRDDLLLAKSQLTETMDEMDQTVKERFYHTFAAISEAFATLFPQIFGGGCAKLILTQPDDLLHTGIEIEAQPPGKKLQTLTLLSGGEQALTAITLLFAILKVNPSPFCVLDEVEAALDEANVLRLSYYLQQFDQQTQFIMITHRKGTMEAADTLYGVTMPESGVSKVISVRLEEIDKNKKGR